MPRPPALPLTLSTRMVYNPWSQELHTHTLARHELMLRKTDRPRPRRPRQHVSDCGKHAGSHSSFGYSSAAGGPLANPKAGYTVMIGHCIHSSDLASLGKAYHWSPCPPCTTKKSVSVYFFRNAHSVTMFRRVHTHTHTHAHPSQPSRYI